MKLLFDENLAPKLVGLLASVFPESTHVHTVGLGSDTDAAVWAYAATARGSGQSRPRGHIWPLGYFANNADAAYHVA